MIVTGQFVYVVPDVGVEPHPGIVIAVSDDKTRVLVICGTGTKWSEFNPVLIDPFKPDGASAAKYLTKPTYFHLNGVRSCDIGSLDTTRRPFTKCPNSKWVRVKLLAVDGCRARVAEPDYRQWLSVVAGE